MHASAAAAPPPAGPGRVLFIGLDGPALRVLCALAEAPGPLPCVLERRSVTAGDVAAGHYPRRLLGRPRLVHAFARLAGRRPDAVPPPGTRAEDALLAEAVRRHRVGEPGGHVAEGLVARFDWVVQTFAPWHRYEWDPPLEPDVPVLQLVVGEDGRLRRCGTSRWAERGCLDCALRRAEAAPAVGWEAVVRELTTPSAPRPGAEDPWPGDCRCRLGAEPAE